MLQAVQYTLVIGLDDHADQKQVLKVQSPHARRERLSARCTETSCELFTA